MRSAAVRCGRNWTPSQKPRPRRSTAACWPAKRCRPSPRTYPASGANTVVYHNSPANGNAGSPRARFQFRRAVMLQWVSCLEYRHRCCRWEGQAGMDEAIVTARKVAERIVSNVERVIVGKASTVELAVVGLMSKGHLLIEDAPGVGKTMLARSLAKSIHCSFKRIQFTPDMLPGDITGVSVYNQKTGDFEFRPGPIMANIVLADEINRATPKVQSALLECMEEHQVTVDGVTHPMPLPFHVLATQNPVEYEGTFPLPETQMDRFLMRIHLGYPTLQEEVTIMEQQQLVHPIEKIKPV